MSIRGVHNSSRGLDAKLELRRQVLALVNPAHVLECYAGPGEMWGSVWRAAASCTGIDLTWDRRDERRRFVGDTLRIMRAIELEPFNVFDIDAFGAPWPAFEVLVRRRRFACGELIGLVVTDGSEMRTKFGFLGAAQQRVLGAKSKRTIPGIENSDFLHAQTFRAACARIGATRRAWSASCWTGRGGGRMAYLAAVIEARGSET